MKNILGIDEVGRGPWAGPLVVGATILPRDKLGELAPWTKKLTDSKKLSEKRREEFSKLILENSLATGLGWVSSRELDEIGLSEALKLATRRAVSEIKLKNIPFTEIVIDGTVNFLAGTSLEKYVTNLKKADFLIKEVSAASIIAKVARDNYMKSLAEVYPGYGFEKHVGYGTSAHKSALSKLGACPEHRRSFRPVAAIIGNVSPEGLPQKSQKITTKMLGDKGETVVVKYLEENNHKVIARNHKTKFYEIDIISVKSDHIYFTEVKYRKDIYRGNPFEMITKQKLKQMTFAAESFLKYSPVYRKNFSPLLAAASVSGSDFHFDEWLVLK